MAVGFVRERAHFPRPVSPLFASLVLPAVERGYRSASFGQGGAPGAITLEVVDGYVYTAWSRLEAPHAHARPLPAIVAEWERERAAEVESLLASIRGMMRMDVPPRRAAGELDALGRALERLYELHYDTGMTVRGAIAGLEGFLRARGDPSPEGTVATLLAPCDSLLREVEAWLAGLGGADPVASPFWPRVRDRPSRLDLDAPTWGEQPALARKASAAGDARAFAEGAARALARRDEAEREAAARFSPEERPVFAMILDALRRARSVHQTLNFLVGEIALGAARGVALRAGARLGLGEDVVLLRVDELKDALQGAPVPSALLAQRRAERERAHALSPPDALGDPAVVPAEVRAMLGAEASGARGMGASPGRARGPARVVREEADLEKLQEGEILVVAALEPTWTPAMQRAAAIVAELGGLLSHAAIVARELGKPAVVGAAGATRRFRSGVMMEVDGASGDVREQA